MKTVLRTRLSYSALAAASSLIAISAPAQAQSVCSLTGTTFLCTNGGATGTVDATAALNGTFGQGLYVTDAGTLVVSGSGTVNSTAVAPALIGISTGSLTVNTGSSGAVNLANTGTGGGALLVSTTGSTNATLGNIASVNNSALLAIGATGTSVSTGNLTSTNINVLGFTVPASAALSAAAEIPAGTTVDVGAGAATIATTGNSALTVNGNLAVTGSTTPLLGAMAYAPAGSASVTVNGNATVTQTGTGNVLAVYALGDTDATARVTGLTTLIAPAGGTAIGAFANTGTATVSCGTVNATGPGVTGVEATGVNVAINCGNVTVSGADSTGVRADAVGTLNATVGNVSATGVDANGIILNNATGPITLNAGTITTAGNNGGALVVTGGTGAVNLTTGAIQTNGTSSPGVFASTTTGSLAITTGAVTTLGTTSAGIFAQTGTGNLTVNSGKLTTNGSGLVTITGAGNQNLTVAGTQSTGLGILANSGTGTITINATAPVVSTTNIGINVNTAAPTVTITENGVSGVLGGVRVNDTAAGNVSLTAAGGMTTATGGDAIQLATLGTASTTIGSAAAVRAQNGFDSIDTRGTLGNTVVISGNVGVDGAGNAINATGGATTVNVNSGGILVGPVSLTANNDTMNLAGSFTPVGTVAFGGGTDVVNVTTGALLLTAGSNITGLETINNASGVNVIGTTTLTGTTFNNSGLVNVTAGAGTLAGLTAFNNSGTITMVDGAANDSLTIPGSYNGSGAARLAIDVDGSLNSADRLNVGGAITGSTVIDVNLLNAPLYNPTGVVVVDGGSTVSTGAFTLAAGDTQSGFLNYGLVQSGNDTILRSTLDPSFTDIAFLGSVGQDLWYQSFDAYHDAIMGRHAGSLVTGNNIGIWGNLYESKDRYGDDNRTAVVNGTTITYSDKLRTHRRGAQLGLEFRGPGFVIGATGGYEWARNEENPAPSRIRAEGHNYGAYAHFGMASGLYAGVLVKRDDYTLRFANDARSVAFRTDAHSTGVDGEVGLKTGGAPAGIAFDLNAGLSYVKTDIDGWNQYGLTFDWQKDESLRGRLGARVLFPSAWGAYVGAKVMHEFRNDGYLRVAGTTTVADIDMANRGTWVRLEGGLSGIAGTGALLSVWGDLGDAKSFGARVGFAF